MEKLFQGVQNWMGENLLQGSYLSIYFQYSTKIKESSNNNDDNARKSVKSEFVTIPR